MKAVGYNLIGWKLKDKRLLFRLIFKDKIPSTFVQVHNVTTAVMKRRMIMIHQSIEEAVKNEISTHEDSYQYSF